MRSIRGRFLAVSVVSVSLALTLAGFFFVSLFTRGLENRIDQELTSHVNNLAGTLQFAADGSVILPEGLTDRRFVDPYGGLYWQIEDDARGQQLRSKSLWDYALPLPDHEQESGTTHRYRLEGPDSSHLIVQERKIIIAAPDGPRAIRLSVAIDTAAIDAARQEFVGDLIPNLVGLAVFLIAASLLQLTYGLRPISAVSEGLDRIRERRSDRLVGRFPKELSGMVDAVNRLLGSQEAIISRAKTRAADLAHGLKTPLTILSNDALTLQEKGETELGQELAHLASTMRTHVDRELIRSRIAASADLRRSDANPAKIADGIVKTLKRSPHGENLTWTVDIAPSVTLAIDPHDLQELLGNLLENAGKWGRTAVWLRLDQDKGRPRLLVEDDGPGADPDQISRMCERGVRLDTQKPGTGIGLSIVREIADVYDLALSIENRDQGGLRVSIGF
ncbi:MAG: sensor histidine kinase [Allorhizobium sp.]